MNNQQQELKSIVCRALETFNNQETYLIKNDLSERCICSKFAMHLTNALQDSEYSEYIVDVEYNRGMDGNERSPKRANDKLITVDLIVHKRGYDCNYGFDNLICIEMKKSTDRRGCDADEERLKEMCGSSSGFSYKIGFMLLVNMKQHYIEIKNMFLLEG